MARREFCDIHLLYMITPFLRDDFFNVYNFLTCDKGKRTAEPKHGMRLILSGNAESFGMESGELSLTVADEPWFVHRLAQLTDHRSQITDYHERSSLSE